MVLISAVIAVRAALVLGVIPTSRILAVGTRVLSSCTIVVMPCAISASELDPMLLVP